MTLTAPASAYRPFMTTRIRVYLSDSRADPAHTAECSAQVLLGAPFQLSSVSGAGSLPSATTWNVAVYRSDLPAIPKTGVNIEVIDGDPSTPRRLMVTSVHVNGTGGPLVHFACEARGGAR